MKLVTPEQMRSIDKRTIEEVGIPGLELMENAGRGIAEYTRDRVFAGAVAGKRVGIVCGAGNNGGDGYVVARYLKSWGAVPDVLLLTPRDKIKGDAQENLERLEGTGVSVKYASDLRDSRMLADYELLIDAIFGTGFHGEVREPQKSAIESLNAAGVPILAVDTPSGVDLNTSSVGNSGVRATFTATLAVPKLGHYFYPVREYCGQIEVVDIGIPLEAVEAEGIQTDLVTQNRVRDWVPLRAGDSHKGDCGRLFIIAGSVGLTGAAALAAESAMRAGAGLVKVGVPDSLNDVLEAKLTEAMTRPLPELKKRRCLSVRGLGVILEELRWADAACLGPGIGRNHETQDLVKRLLGKLELPTVVDADGLYPLGGEEDTLRKCRAELVLTPHLGEFARLIGKPVDEISKDRISEVREYAGRIGKTVLLKGPPTLIASADGSVFVSATGNPGMATGGSGDVLTGIIGALLAYGVKPVQAASAGAYLHGIAGDIAAAEVGSFGLIAGDIVASLPDAFIEILG